MPQKVPRIRNVAAISLAVMGRHTLVLLKDGTLRGWGNTDWGQLGAGVSGTFQLSPITPEISGVKTVFAAGNNSFSVRSDNTVWIWGIGRRDTWPLTTSTKKPVRFSIK